MSSICLSVASNLRCSNLTRREQITILTLPSVDLFFCIGLLYINWGKVKLHQWSLILETVVYFSLALFDFLEKDWVRHGLDVAAFQTYDRAIGVLTIFPIFFFTISLALLAKEDILPLSASNRIRRLARFAFIFLIPAVIILNEVAGLVSVTYGVANGQVSQGFTSSSSRDTSQILSNMALTLLAAFQLIIGTFCIFYILRARTAGHGGGVIPGFACVGIGLWFGTAETFIGYAYLPFAAFTLILMRRILKTIGRAVLLSGMTIGTSVEEGFALYPSQPRAMAERNARLMISNPRSSTFVQLTPNAAADFRSTVKRPRDLNLNTAPADGGREWLGRANAWGPIENLAPSNRRNRGPIENVPITSSDQLRRFSTGGLEDVSPREQGRFRSLSVSTPSAAKVKKGFTPFDPDDLARFPTRGNRPGDRVTIHFPGGDYTRPPVLQLRLSDLIIPSPREVMASLRSETPDALSLASVAGHQSHGAYSTNDQEQSTGLLGRYNSNPRRSSIFGMRFPGSDSRDRKGSGGSDASNRIRELAGRLPGLPSAATRMPRKLSFLSSGGAAGGGWSQLDNGPSSSGSGAANAGAVAKPAPIAVPAPASTPSPRSFDTSSPSPRRQQQQPPIRERLISNPTAPPRAAFTQRDRSSSGSRYSDTEAAWMRTGTLPPIRSGSSSGDLYLAPGVARRQPSHLTSGRASRRSRYDSGSRYDESGNSTPTSARIVEARTVNIRPQQGYEYRRNTVGSGDVDSSGTPRTATVVESPMGFGTGVYSLDTPTTPAMKRQFEQELSSQGETRQIYASERRVSRLPPTDPPTGPLPRPKSRLGMEPPLTMIEGSPPERPRIATRALDFESRRGRDNDKEPSPDQQQLSRRWEKSPQRTLPRRFRSISSSVDVTTENAADEPSGQFKSIRQIIARRPTYVEERERDSDQDSVAPEVSTSMTELRERLGQRFAEEELGMDDMGGEGYIPGKALSRKDSGVLSPEDQEKISGGPALSSSEDFHAI